MYLCKIDSVCYLMNVICQQIITVWTNNFEVQNKIIAMKIVLHESEVDYIVKRKVLLSM